MAASTYTDTAASHTVKPTQTVVANNSGKDITLAFASSSSLLIKNGTSSAKISATIASINYNATHYYCAQGNDDTIPANKPVTITTSGDHLAMTIA
ncbi:MAG: hypothetical protein E6Q88_00340 [Lysobacteraceae bacterium]|nr:MAG: hypothetical protein E6Q88_00340 [Xanthomonadaceae bacterium]